MGLNFKGDCPDLRNTRVVDIINELKAYEAQVDVFDPVNKRGAEREYGITAVDAPLPGAYDATIIAVAHRQFKKMGVEGIRALGKENAIIYDVKHIIPQDAVTGRL